MPVPDWDEYFLDIAKVVATRSKDPHTKHGCVLVNKHKRIVGTGYNGSASIFPEEVVPTTRPDKYKWFIHAEENALMFAKDPSVAYITGIPCPGCCLRLIQAGVKRIVVGDVPSASVDEEAKELVSRFCTLASVRLEDKNGLSVRV